MIKRLTAQDIHSIVQWQQFYDKQYEFVGLHIGRFYAKDGSETDYLKKVGQMVELAIQQKIQAEVVRKKYPGCNIEYKEETGTRVWCTEQSGGIDRGWVGVPRKFFEEGKSDFRCACVPMEDIDAEDERLKKYDDCEESATACYYRA